MSLTVLALVSLLPHSLQDAGPSPTEVLRAEAERVSALVECKGTKAFLAATSALPEIGERVVLYDAKAREACTAEEHAKLAADQQAHFQPTSYGGDFYYTTRSGSPLAYARALDVVENGAVHRSGHMVLGEFPLGADVDDLVKPGQLCYGCPGRPSHRMSCFFCAHGPIVHGNS